MEPPISNPPSSSGRVPAGHYDQWRRANQFYLTDANTLNVDTPIHGIRHQMKELAYSPVV